MSSNVPNNTRTTITTAENRIREAARLCSKDPAAALLAAEDGIRLAEASGEVRAAARALYLRGAAHGSRGEIEAAFADLLVALDRSRAIEDRTLESQCLHGLATAHYHQGEFAHALEYMYRCLAIQREDGNEEGLGGSLNSLAAYHGTLGNYAEAVSALTEGLELARKRGNVEAVAGILGNLALVHMECGEYEAALDDFRESVRLADEVGERVMLPNTLANFANAYRAQDRLEEAGEVANRAVHLARDIGNPVREATALLSLGLVYEAQGDLTGAEDSLRRALELIQTSGEERLAAGLLEDLGRFYLRAGDRDAARRCLEEGMERAAALDQKQDVCDLHLALSDLAEADGDAAAALRHYRAYHQADKALHKQSAHNRMMAQLARLEVERAQQQAEIHRLRSIELAEANEHKADLLDDLRRHADRLAREATEDSLTGLYNRRYLNDYLDGEVAQRRRDKSEGAALAIAIADLDNFKQVNDRFTHHIGDEVLKATARVFQRHVRKADVVARYGGEEFVVVLPDAGRERAITVCERVRQAIAEYPWHEIHPDLRVTISIGTADELVEDGQALLALADKRLYRAKQQGKNRVI
jgi:diguanylate cyclase (GGDEF)-like protein